MHLIIRLVFGKNLDAGDAAERKREQTLCPGELGMLSGIILDNRMYVRYFKLSDAFLQLIYLPMGNTEDMIK